MVRTSPSRRPRTSISTTPTHTTEAVNASQKAKIFVNREILNEKLNLTEKTLRQRSFPTSTVIRSHASTRSFDTYDTHNLTRTATGWIPAIICAIFLLIIWRVAPDSVTSSLNILIRVMNIVA
ncbi:unnamed protein product, partial [Rotaria sp. Silwood1]